MAQTKDNARVWLETDELHDHYYQADFMVYLPFYLDYIELGRRVDDHINGPGEYEMLLDMGVDMTAPRFDSNGNKIDKKFWFSPGWNKGASK
jgi:hypothetical protein